MSTENEPGKTLVVVSIENVDDAIKMIEAMIGPGTAWEKEAARAVATAQWLLPLIRAEHRATDFAQGPDAHPVVLAIAEDYPGYAAERARSIHAVDVAGDGRTGFYVPGSLRVACNALSEDDAHDARVAVSLHRLEHDLAPVVVVKLEPRLVCIVSRAGAEAATRDALDQTHDIAEDHLANTCATLWAPPGARDVLCVEVRTRAPAEATGLALTAGGVTYLARRVSREDAAVRVGARGHDPTRVTAALARVQPDGDPTLFLHETAFSLHPYATVNDRRVCAHCGPTKPTGGTA